MFWRWSAVVIFLLVGVFLLQVAGGRLFAADVPDDYYTDPTLKGQFRLWGNIYLSLSLACFGASVVLGVLNIRKYRNRQKE